MVWHFPISTACIVTNKRVCVDPEILALLENSVTGSAELKGTESGWLFCYSAD